MASENLTGDEYFIKFLDQQKLGLKFNGEEITSVTEGGWAALNGIEVDDEIVTVAGQVFRDLAHQERVDLLISGARPLEIKFKRPILKDMYFTGLLNDRKIGMTMKGKYVKTVDPHGWASTQNIQVGDEIAELAEQGYAGLTDKERMQIFSGPRPLTIRFVRRNQKTAFALAREQKTKALTAEQQKWAALQANDNKAIDPTMVGVNERHLADSAILTEKPVASASGFCFCCQSTADKSGEVRVG